MYSRQVIASVQRMSSAVPGVRCVKRQLQNSAAGCGMVYWMSTLGEQPGFRLVTYHRVLESPDPYYSYAIMRPLFDAQLRMFKRFCAVLSLDEIIDRLDRRQPLPPRCMAITFDDGYRDTATVAWPLLKQYDLPATLYVAVQAIANGWLWPDALRYAIRYTPRRSVLLMSLRKEPREFDLSTEASRLRAVEHLDARLKVISNKLKLEVLDELAWKLVGESLSRFTIPGLMLDWAQLRTVCREGLAIGAHTVTHPILTQVSDREAEGEISLSKRMLEGSLGVPVRHFAYPNGGAADFARRHQEMVRAAGFSSAVTTAIGINRLEGNRVALKRVDCTHPSLRQFVRHLVGGASS